jgi:hypothetical protein
MQEPVGNLTRVISVFITPDGSPYSDPDGKIYGRSQRVHQLDVELGEFFGDKPMVIFK